MLEILHQSKGEQKEAELYAYATNDARLLFVCLHKENNPQRRNPE